MTQRKRGTAVFILLAPGFDEEFVVRCACQMRQAGVNVSLVGLHAGLIKGTHNLWLQAEYALADLEQLANQQPRHMLVLPGPPGCTMQLLLDPRVHRAVEVAFAGGGQVATISAQTRDLLQRSGLATPEEAQRFLFQGHLATGAYIKQMIRETQATNTTA